MAEDQRVLLEQLMGKDAMISPVVRRRDPDMTSNWVCKSFLVGTCPHDLFVGTKQDMGKCPKLHLEKHKMEYEHRKQQGEQFPQFEQEYFQHLKSFLSDYDRTIALAMRKLEYTPEEKAKIAEVTLELERIDTRIGVMTQEIDHLTNHHQSTKSLEQTIKLNQLYQQRKGVADNARDVAANIRQSAQQKLQPCEACGAFLSRLDNDRRLADHFVGKIHLGFVQMRLEYDKLKDRFNTSTYSAYK